MSLCISEMLELTQPKWINFGFPGACPKYEIWLKSFIVQNETKTKQI